MIEFPHPESRVTESKLGGMWLVDNGKGASGQAFRDYDDALAEAFALTALDLRRQADMYERAARARASDPDLLTA